MLATLNKDTILGIQNEISMRVGDYMAQGTGEHKKSNQGFASVKYDQSKKRAAQSKGGQAHVAKWFAKMSPEKRREIAKKGGKA